MSPRKKVSMRIALPPRVNLAIAQGSDSLSSPMSTPGPHTPSPYNLMCTPTIEYQPSHEETVSDDEPVAGQKRSREEEEVPMEWTAEEVDEIRSTLIHPFRPIAHTYPPGELPPSEALDDLTSQLLKHAFRPGSSSHRSTPKLEAIDVARVERSEDVRTSGWKHGWDATRKKLFEVALAESNFGKDDKERKMPRAERRAQRPGLKRVDSMDFLDQGEDNQGEHIGRALRLSTTLQNTAKADPVLIALSRTPSGSSTGLSDPMDRLSAGTPIASITLTPPSPQPDRTLTDSPTTLSTTLSPMMIPPPMPSAPPLRRRASNRTSMPRPQRPSLLQRGRSFTASDLQAENAESNSPTKETPSPVKEHPASMPSTASPGSSAPSSSVKSPPSPSPIEHFQPSLKGGPPRLTRSLSSIVVGESHPAHSQRAAFLAHPPTLTNGPMLSSLAQPAQIGLGIKAAKTSGGEWSDSEDESTAQKSRGKKMKGGRKIIHSKRLELAIGPALGHLSGLAGVEGDSLRSPFEEKGLQF